MGSLVQSVSLSVSPVSSSVGVALSRGHGKYFFRGNVSVDAGMSFMKSLNTVRCVSLCPACFWRLIVSVFAGWHC